MISGVEKHGDRLFYVPMNLLLETSSLPQSWLLPSRVQEYWRNNNTPNGTNTHTQTQTQAWAEVGHTLLIILLILANLL